MRHLCIFLFCLLVSAFAYGQESRADLFAGYSYLNVDTNGMSSRQSFNGWEGAISGNFNKWFAVETDVSGYYKNYNILGSNVAVRDYSYAAGPRVNYKPLFIHALFGGVYQNVSGASASQNGLAGGFGGGVQWKFSRQLSFRTSADYVFSRFNVSGGSALTQNNVRASVGIVYSFGSTERASATPRQDTPHGSGGGMLIPALGITAVASGQGVEITDEAPNGAAARAGLQPGDVIDAADGKPVKTPMELGAELSSRAAGDKIKLGCLIHGQWQTETVVSLGASH